jgi:hypothetical protein
MALMGGLPPCFKYTERDSKIGISAAPKPKFNF